MPACLQIESERLTIAIQSKSRGAPQSTWRTVKRLHGVSRDKMWGVMNAFRTGPDRMKMVYRFAPAEIIPSGFGDKEFKGKDVVEALINSIGESDYEEYMVVQNKMRELINKGQYDTDEFHELYRKNEEIKNRNHGVTPQKPQDEAKKVIEGNEWRSVVLQDGTAIVGRSHPIVLRDAEERGYATTEQLVNAIAAYTLDDGRTFTVSSGSPLETTRIVWLDRLREDVLVESPEQKTLKDNKVKLTDEERSQVMNAKAVWHMGGVGADATPAVWKSVVNGVTWYGCNTHRCIQVKKTLKAAIRAFHEVVEPSA